MASNLEEMAPNLIAMASNQIAMASNPEEMAPNLIAMASNPEEMAPNLIAMASNQIAMASNLVFDDWLSFGPLDSEGRWSRRPTCTQDFVACGCACGWQIMWLTHETLQALGTPFFQAWSCAQCVVRWHVARENLVSSEWAVWYSLVCLEFDLMKCGEMRGREERGKGEGGAGQGGRQTAKGTAPGIGESNKTRRNT